MFTILRIAHILQIITLYFQLRVFPSFYSLCSPCPSFHVCFMCFVYFLLGRFLSLLWFGYSFNFVHFIILSTSQRTHKYKYKHTHEYIMKYIYDISLLVVFFSLLFNILCQWHAQNWNDRKDIERAWCVRKLVWWMP